MRSELKKSIMISCVWHMSAFLLFGFTLGRKIPRFEYTRISFLGQILPRAEFTRAEEPRALGNNFIFSHKANLRTQKTRDDLFPFSQYYIKPSLPLTTSEKRTYYLQNIAPRAYGRVKKESVLMLYPRLPMHFALYFKDRQIVHLELLFKISSSGSVSPIFMKRKISSGNLDVDLLAMRYIGHYLFIQQNKFPKEIWQSIKIDLSAKNN